MIICSRRLGVALLHPGEEVQTRLGMDWGLFGCVAHRLGAWNTKRLRFANYHGALPRSQENPTATGCGVMASYGTITNFTIGSDFGCQYHATNVTGFTINNGCGPSGGGNHHGVDSVHSPVVSAAPSVKSYMDITSAPLISVPVPVEPPAVCVDSSCVLHPFYVHKLDSGPVRLMTIAHAFNYRVAVLRDGVQSAIRIGRSRKAETCFLTEVNISWGQQVTVMFQIVSTMMAEVPDFAALMRELKGESPNIQLYSEPWGHVEHCDTDCTCLSSDRTASYVHGLLPMPGKWEDESTCCSQCQSRSKNVAVSKSIPAL